MVAASRTLRSAHPIEDDFDVATTPEDAARWCERYFPEKTPDVIVFGDTHTELIRKVDGILCVNPGSPTYPHNYDTQFGTLGFLELDAGTASASVWLINEKGSEPYNWDAPPKWKL